MPMPGLRPEAPDALDHGPFVGRFLTTLGKLSSGMRPRHMVVTGLSGCGKSSLVEACCVAARQRGFAVIRPDKREGQFIGSLHDELVRAHPSTRARTTISSVGVTGIGIPAGPGINATLSRNTSPYEINALTSLLAQTAHAQNRFRKQSGGVIIRIDDINRLAPEDLTTLNDILDHLSTRHTHTPVVLLASARPEMKSQAEITGAGYEFIPLRERLTPAETETLLQAPAVRIGRHWHNNAIGLAGRETLGHPAYVQILADETWHTARNVVINREDVTRAIPAARERFETRYLGPQRRGLSLPQQEFMTVIAAHGGTSTAQSVAEALGRPVDGAVQISNHLQREGLLTHIPDETDGILQATSPQLVRYAAANHRRLEGQHHLPSLEQLRAHAPQNQPQPQSKGRGLVLDPELKQIMELYRAGSPTPPIPRPPGKNSPRTTPRRGTTPPVPRRGLER